MENHGKRWTENDIKFLFNELRNNSDSGDNISNIAVKLKRTPIAVNGKICEIANLLINIIGIDMNTVSELIKVSPDTLNQLLKYKNSSKSTSNSDSSTNNVIHENSEKLLEEFTYNKQNKTKLLEQNEDIILNEKQYKDIILNEKQNKNIILNKKQQKAFDEFETGKNVFITGPAGTGKSITLNKIIEYSKENNKKYGITSTTGSSALLIGGKTIHSYLGIGKGNRTAHELFVDVRYKYKHTMTKIRELDILIIDEISMMNSELFDKISCFLCLCRKSTDQFGGLQVVLTGDFCQLESVEGDFCFNSYSWNKLNLEVIFLNKMIRQNEDKKFQRILGDLRYGICSDDTYQLLCECKNTIFNEIKPTILYSRNTDVDKINKTEFDKLILNGAKTSIYSIILPEMKKNHDKINNWIKSLDIKESIELCIGAQIVITANINQEIGLVNGTRGIIIDTLLDRVIIKTMNETYQSIEYHKCTSTDDSTIYFKYMPIKLAYALTIHKAQGMTLDAIEIDIGDKIFASGQAYTALSRGRSLNSIKIKSVSKDSFIIKDCVIDFYRKYDNTLI